MLALALATLSSLSHWPLCHSYFNSAAAQLFVHPPLLESNLEWGEDLDMAIAWMRRNLHARPVYHAVMTDGFASYMNHDWQRAPHPITSGWYVVSLQRMLDPRDRFAFLLGKRPHAYLGDSLRVYRVTQSQVR